MKDSSRPPSGPLRSNSRGAQLWTLNLLLAAGFAAALPPPEETFLRQVLLRNPSMQAESLSLAGSRETRTGANSLLLPQFNLTADATAASNFDDYKGASSEGTGQVSQILPTAATVQGTVFGGQNYSGRPGLDRNWHDTVGIGIYLTQPFLRGFGEGSETFYA